MRNKLILATVLTVSASSLAWAQSGTVAQQSPAPVVQQGSMAGSKLPPGVPAGAVREYPGNGDTMATPVTSPTTMDGPGAIPALPLEIMTTGDVRYINGGISDEEMAQLKSMGKEFNTHILLTANNGEWVSDITAKITDAKGAIVLTVGDAGPSLYVALKPGTYNLELDKGTVLAQKAEIKVGKGIWSKQFRFTE